MHLDERHLSDGHGRLERYGRINDLHGEISLVLLREKVREPIDGAEPQAVRSIRSDKTHRHVSGRRSRRCVMKQPDQVVRFSQNDPALVAVKVGRTEVIATSVLCVRHVYFLCEVQVKCGICFDATGENGAGEVDQRAWFVWFFFLTGVGTVCCFCAVVVLTAVGIPCCFCVVVVLAAVGIPCCFCVVVVLAAVDSLFCFCVVVVLAAVDSLFCFCVVVVLTAVGIPCCFCVVVVLTAVGIPCCFCVVVVLTAVGILCCFCVVVVLTAVCIMFCFCVVVVLTAVGNLRRVVVVLTAVGSFRCASGVLRHISDLEHFLCHRTCNRNSQQVLKSNSPRRRFSYVSFHQYKLRHG